MSFLDAPAKPADAFAVSGSLTAAGNVESGVDLFGYNSVSVHVSGTFSAVLNFEVTLDGTTWLSVNLASLQNLTAPSTAPGTGSMWAGSFPMRRFRVRTVSYTSGTINITMVFSTASFGPMASSVSLQGTPTFNLGTGGSSATSLGKAEDAVAASSDVGVGILGVRAPLTPAVPTSAAGDYGHIMVDSEGKIVPSDTSIPDLYTSNRVDFTTTSSVTLFAGAGTGTKVNITDIIIENTGVASARFLLFDVASLKFSATVPAGETRSYQLKTPLRPAAQNTIWNGQLGAAGTVTVTGSGFRTV